eukprot:snap_masked-scaffold_3-processed-gene-20.22-mRNA-1 protein AED:1.00 eAED:1.00 QI:0/0/0/0/1/1/2/0/674
MKNFIQEILDFLEDWNRSTHPFETYYDERYRKKLQMEQELESYEKNSLNHILEIIRIYLARDALLQSLVKRLFELKRGEVSRKDETLFGILITLFCFYAKDMKVGLLTLTLVELVPEKVLILANFLKSNDANEIFQEYFDIEYTKTLLSFCFSPPFIQIETKLRSRASSLQMEKEEKKLKKQPKQKTLTKPKPFSLSKSRVKKFPKSQRIGKELKAKPIPASLKSVNLELLQRERVERLEMQRADCLEKFLRARKKFSFDLSKGKDSKKKLQIENERKIKNMLKESFKASKAPNFDVQEANVPTNKAAVLREEIVFRLQQEKEYIQLKQFEANLRDSFEFDEWKKKMKEQDLKKKMNLVSKRREDAEKTFYRAKEASQKVRKKKIEEGKRLRKDLKDKLQKNEIEMTSKQEKLRTENVIRKEKNQKDLKAQRELNFEAKRLEGIKERSLKEKRLVERDVEKQREVEKRREMVLQIQAIERNIERENKIIDKTYKPSFGFLDGMSYFEMEQRLAWNKTRLDSLVQERRKRIQERKKKQETEMKTKIKNIQRIRSLKRQHFLKEKQKKIRNNLLAKQLEEEHLEKKKSFHRKRLEEKEEKVKLRQEKQDLEWRNRIQEKENMRKQNLQKQMSSQSSLHASMKRRAQERQEAVQEEMKLEIEIKRKERNQRYVNKKN